MELATNIKLTGEPRRRVRELTEQYNKDNPTLPLLLNGRMTIWILDDYFKVHKNDRKTIEHNQFLSLRMHNNDLRDFKNRFTTHVGKMLDVPEGYILEERFRAQYKTIQRSRHTLSCTMITG